ncbi:MAG TPA: CDP-diacylglycerol diphosphatase [Acetobacteraceae bacterium]|nr:CDP-diacylglycerol diphosphatase [Acetobacteraceae bacterium]
MIRRAHRLLLMLLLAGVAPAAGAADPSALWHIVHDRCVPDEQGKQDPAPCVAVNLAGGYAVLKDRVGDTQFLLIPTARVGGIEDQSVLAPDAPNYWDDAWRARRYVAQRAGHALPRDDIALAINSTSGRTQNQLHIHVDCIRPDVRAALTLHQAEIGPQWSEFPVRLAGHRYRAMRLVGAELGTTNPFRLLSAGVPEAEMGAHTLVLAGATFAPGQPGFILLDDRADPAAGDRGSGESLQDHDCALAR